MNAYSDSWRDDALDVLDDVLHWHRSPADWRAIDTALAALDQAVDSHDDDAEFRATTDLELLSPCRCRASSHPDSTPVPDPTAHAARRTTAKLAPPTDRPQQPQPIP